MKLKKMDYLNAAAIGLSLISLVILVVGAIGSVPTSVGLNLNLSPLVYVGIALAVISLVCAIVGSSKTEKLGLNKRLSSLALYLTVIVVLIVPVVVLLTILMPVINPSNG